MNPILLSFSIASLLAGGLAVILWYMSISGVYEVVNVSTNVESLDYCKQLWGDTGYNFTMINGYCQFQEKHPK